MQLPDPWAANWPVFFKWLKASIENDAKIAWRDAKTPVYSGEFVLPTKLLTRLGSSDDLQELVVEPGTKARLMAVRVDDQTKYPVAIFTIPTPTVKEGHIVAYSVDWRELGGQFYLTEWGMELGAAVIGDFELDYGYSAFDPRRKPRELMRTVVRIPKEEPLEPAAEVVVWLEQQQLSEEGVF